MFAAVLALSLVVSADAKEKELSAAAKKELKALEGKWTATKVVVYGNELPAAETEDKPIEFKGQKFLLAGKDIFDIVALDPSADPKLIDFKGLADMGELRKDTVYEAIYKLEKDTLSIAIYFGSGQSRPAKFESAKDSKVAIITLEREKK